MGKVHFEDDFPFPQVGYVNFLEGIWYWPHPWKRFTCWIQNWSFYGFDVFVCSFRSDPFRFQPSRFRGEVSPRNDGLKQELCSSKNVGTWMNKVSFFVHALLEHANKVRQEVGFWRVCWCSKSEVDEFGWYPPLKNSQRQDESFFKGSLLTFTFHCYLGWDSTWGGGYPDCRDERGQSFLYHMYRYARYKYHHQCRCNQQLLHRQFLLRQHPRCAHRFVLLAVLKKMLTGHYTVGIITRRRTESTGSSAQSSAQRVLP